MSDFIGKIIANELRYNRPIEPLKKSVCYTDKELKHFQKCKTTAICDQCSKILSKIAVNGSKWIYS